MWAHMRMHHMEDTVHTAKVKKKDWRDHFKKEIKAHGEQGFYLKGLRLREGYTQVKLGQLIDTAPNNISAMENGHRSIGKDIAHRLAKVFNTDYRNFL